MAYRLYSKLQTFHGITGQVLASGELRFFASDEITPKAVYTDSTGSVSNGSVIDLDASGRPNVEMWGTGDYFVQVVDYLGAVQGSEVITQGGGSGIPTIPIPLSGEFLTGDGLNLIAETVLQVPDPTGLSGKYLGTDGTAILWQDGPAAPTIPNLTTSSTGFRVGDYEFQFGSGSAPASGGHSTTVAITFGHAFNASETPKVFITPTIAEASASGFIPSPSVITTTSTGCTVKFDTNEGDALSGKITNAVAFNWIAFGKAP